MSVTKADMTIKLGANPVEHEITTTAGYVQAASVRIDLTKVHPTALVECYLDHFTLEGRLCVTYLGPFGYTVPETTERLYHDLLITIEGSARLCYLDRELFLVTDIEIYADVTSSTQVVLKHYHRPFPESGEPQLWLLHGHLVKA